MRNIKLSLEKQLEILDDVDIMDLNFGLCLALYRSIARALPYEHIYPDEVNKVIPLFKLRNAIFFGANPFNTNNYWWKLNERGFDKRLMYLSWMRRRIRKRVSNKEIITKINT